VPAACRVSANKGLIKEKILIDHIIYPDVKEASAEDFQGTQHPHSQK
jgi:hypothetical protein